MSGTTENNTQELIPILKGQIKKKAKECFKLSLTNKELYEDVIRLIYKHKDTDYLEERVNDKLHILCDSKVFGKKSLILPYTYKTGKNKGKTFPAHYTIYGTFIKMCKKQDEEPIYYTGWFPIKEQRDKFEFNFSRPIDYYRDLSHFFQLKQ